MDEINRWSPVIFTIFFRTVSSGWRGRQLLQKMQQLLQLLSQTLENQKRVCPEGEAVQSVVSDVDQKVVNMRRLNFLLRPLSRYSTSNHSRFQRGSDQFGSHLTRLPPKINDL